MTLLKVPRHLSDVVAKSISIQAPILEKKPVLTPFHPGSLIGQSLKS
jgi:hypothetical protein